MSYQDNRDTKTIVDKEVAEKPDSTEPRKTFSLFQTKETEEKKKTVPVYKLFRFSSTLDKLLITIAFILSAGTGALIPVSIIFLGAFLNILSEALSLSDTSNLLDATLPVIKIFAYMGTATILAAYLSNCFWVLTGENQTRQIKKAYLNSIMHQDMSWFDKAKDGSLTTRLGSDTQIIQDGLSEKFGFMITCIFQFIAGFIVAFIKGWHLAVIMLAAVPIMAIVGGGIGFLITKYTLQSQDKYAEAGSIAEQVFSGIRTVYSFSLQDRFAELYESKLEKALHSGIKRGSVLGYGFGIFMFILLATYGLAFWYGTQLIIKGEIDAGTVLVVFYSMIMGAQSLMELPPNLAAVSSASGAAYKIFETIDRIPEINKQAPGIVPDTLDGCIEFKHVQFNYPTRPDVPILKDLHLKISPGQTVAFVGPSGSGKSTSIQLLQRFYDPKDGQILLDNQDIKTLDISWLRSQIGVVSQEPVLFNMSIRQNLLLGMPEGMNVTESDLERACTEANCHSFISKLPDGYDTMVGDQGGMLSGGQKQRIAIARAILKNPTILLLDEATSALDTQSERIVQRALDAATINRTTIVVAHRLSTIRNADLIVVMNHGELIEQGTHQELLQLNGIYSDLVKKQEVLMTQDEYFENSDDSSAAAATVDEDDALIAKFEADKKLEAYIHTSRKSISSESNSSDNINDIKNDMIIKLENVGLEAFELKLRQAKKTKKLAKTQRTPVSRVFSEMKPEWRYLAIGIVGAIVSGCVFPVFALVLAKVITIIVEPESNLDPGPFQGPNLYAFLFVVIGIACFFGYSAQFVSFEIAGEKYTRRLRAILFQQYMKQEIGFFDEDDNTTGALTTKLAVDAKNVNEMITRVWGDVIQVIITAIVGLVIAFVYSWALSLVVLALAPFIIGATYYETYIYNDYEDSTKKANAQCGEVAGEAVKEIRTVTTLNRQNFFEDRYAKASERPHRLAIKKAVLSSIGFALLKGISMYANALSFYAGIRFIMIDLIDFQSMYISMMSIIIAAENVGRCSTFAKSFSKAKFAAISIFDILDRKTSMDYDLEGKEPAVGSLHGDVEFHNIAFSYPARPKNEIFSGKFNLKGKAGTTIALVGPSGCGKSTTIGMLQRWYDPTQGQVSLDNNDVKSYTIRNLRAHMALVGQEPILFDMSIGDNVRFGVDNEIHGTATEEQIEEACKSANIHEFITSLPDGYNTRVGDKGSQLSGGQKQRIAIARALIRKPTVLLLDEATSALDSDSEKVVQAALDNIIEKGGRTTVTIAHRLSTIQNADLICVVKDGIVAEQGTHWELLELNGIYKGLVLEQSLAA